MIDFELTEGQNKALAMVSRLMSLSGTRVGVLAGYAGTGKSTTIKAIANKLGMPIIVAPTGKAAARIKELSGLPASTIHRWLYNPIEDEKTHEMRFVRKSFEQMERGAAGVIILDEASMVSRALWNDLLDTAIVLELKILAVGDPFQLPPVDPEDKDSSGFSLLDKDNDWVDEYFMLTEIVRQAKESVIIRASMCVRGGDIWKGINLLPQITPDQFIDKADEIQNRGGMIVCHKNSTRNSINRKIRAARKLPEGVLQDGEPLLVIRNNYNTATFNGEGYTFDSWVEGPAGLHSVWDHKAKKAESSRFGVAKIVDQLDGRSFQAVLSEAEVFGNMQASPSSIAKTAGIVHGEKPFIDANLGYALSCHKSQGSESADVLVAIEPSIPLWKEEGLRWVYTALTRSSARCTICIGYTN